MKKLESEQTFSPAITNTWVDQDDPSRKTYEVILRHDCVFCYPPTNCLGEVRVHFHSDRIKDKLTVCQLCHSETTVNIPGLQLTLFGLTFVRRLANIKTHYS